MVVVNMKWSTIVAQKIGNSSCSVGKKKIQNVIPCQYWFPKKARKVVTFGKFR